MKMILLAASALALGGIAQAQDATQQPAAPAAAPADPAMAAPAAAPAAAPMAPASGVPADTAATAAATDDSKLPMCSKTVTDKCTQGGGGHGHHMMKHKKK